MESNIDTIYRVNKMYRIEKNIHSFHEYFYTKLVEPLSHVKQSFE